MQPTARLASLKDWLFIIIIYHGVFVFWCSIQCVLQLVVRIDYDFLCD